MSPGASLKTVAEAAGVSPSTVSNAYNKPAQLSAEVRARVLEVARQQGYAGPDAAARSLRSGRSGAIGLLFTERLSYAFSDPYSVGMLAGLAEIAEQSLTSLLLIPLQPPSVGDAASLAESVETVRHAVVDGVVAYCVDPDHPARRVVLDRGLPLVSTTDTGEETGRCVLIDEVGSARLIGEHLRRLGHRRVAVVIDSAHPAGQTSVVTELDEPKLYADERLRLQGFRAGLGDGTELTVVSGGHNSERSGLAAAAVALDRRDRPTAILTVSDVLALGVLAAMEQRRLKPGYDISVTGFDDVPAAEHAGLTTVRQPIAEKGRLLARMLLDAAFTDNRVVLPTELIVRSSTGPVR